MWSSKGDEDWLLEDSNVNPPPGAPSGLRVDSFSSEVDLTTIVQPEPLLNLPEAPPCQIRMFSLY